MTITLTWTSSSHTDTRSYYPNGYTPGGETVAIQRTATYWKSNLVEHDIKDSKGRSIGNYATIADSQTLLRDGVPAPSYGALPKVPHTESFAPEVTYYVCTHATRNGRPFGACATRGTVCKTLEEAKALAAKKIVEAGKRFARAAAKGEGRQFKKAAAS